MKALIFTAFSALLCAYDAIAIRSGAANRTYKDDDDEDRNQKEKRDNINGMNLRTARSGPDVMFKKIRNREVEHLDQILERNPFQKSLFMSTGYHVLTAALFCRDIETATFLIDNMDDSDLFQQLDPQGNNVFHLCAMLDLKELIEHLIERARERNSVFQIKKMLTAQNFLRSTPYDIADAYKNKELCGMLDESNITKSRGKNDDRRRGSRYRSIRDDNENDDNRYYSRSKNRKNYDYDDNDDSVNNKKSYENKNKKREEPENVKAARLAGYDDILVDIIDENISKLERVLLATPQAMLKKIDLFDNNVFHILAMFGEHKVISKIISSHVKRNDNQLYSAINMRNYLGNTPIHITACMNDFISANAFLSYDSIDLSRQNNSGMTPAMTLIRNYKWLPAEKPEIWELIHLINVYGLHARVGRNHLAMKDDKGNTAYHFASMQGSLKNIIEFALYGSNVNARNKRGETGEDKMSESLYGVDFHNGNHSEKISTFGHMMDLIAKGDKTSAVEAAQNIIKVNKNDIHKIQPPLYNQKHQHNIYRTARS